MDVLRQAYTAQMRFFQDSFSERTVTWYFVEEEPKALGMNTMFASRIYDRGVEPQEHLGELYEPVEWAGGQAPAPSSKSGRCGSESQWVNGLSITDPGPTTWPGTSIPMCCDRPLNVAPGGIALGGLGVLSPCCAGITLPTVITVFYRVFFAFCPPLDLIPFNCAYTEETPSWIPGVPRWKSEPIDFDGTPLIAWVYCDTFASAWGIYWASPDGTTVYPTTGFDSFDSTCSPFRLFAPHQFWPFIAPLCDIVDAEVEALPAT